MLTSVILSFFQWVVNDIWLQLFFGTAIVTQTNVFNMGAVTFGLLGGDKRRS